ncbi:MAG: arylsulfatase A-like enzyme/4-amino-4-deoxy-L-arabinose transferase-like glycosyltransferase [Planctomycetota bacterium]|jgi:arylsulfatase A-like enzyme/4-amino-4-deoxy-L-arabinose transferase-like glycosyltransferase
MSSDDHASTDRMPADRPALRWITLIVALSTVLKVALLLGFVPSRNAVDEHCYIEGAKAIVQDGIPSYPNPNWDEAHASPVFPYFLAACLKVVGEDHFEFVARMLQVLISSLSILLVWSIARRAFSERVGMLAAAGVAFYPPLVFFSQYLLSETLYIFFMLASASILMRKQASTDPRAAFFAGILGGLAALTRSVFLINVPLVLWWMLRAKQTDKRRRVLSMGLFLVGIGLVVGPWSIRNTVRYDGFLLIDSNTGNVLHKNVNAVRPENYDFGLHKQRAEEIKNHSGTPPLRERVVESGIAARNSAEVHAALNYATDYPGRYLRNTVLRAADLFNPTSMVVRYIRFGRYESLSPAAAELLIGLVLMSCMLALVGGVVGLMQGVRNEQQSLMALFMLGNLVVCVLIISDSRYRLPMMPFWIPFAIYGAHHMKSILHNGRGRIALVLLAGLGALWAYYLPFTYSTDDAREEAPATGANLLLISIDSLRADHLHCYGYERETSPVIDALAAEGTVFENTMSQAPWTLPSHASLLTGMYPRAHQVTLKERRLPAGKATTLARALAGGGYDTMAVVSGPFMQSQFRMDRGFEQYDDTIAQGGHKRSHRAITSPKINQKALKMLESAEPPFFMFLHYWDVHYDYQAPEPYHTMFDPDYQGTITGNDFASSGEVHEGMDPRDLEHVLALYDGEIAWVDFHIGQIIAALKERGLYENTVIAVTSDHGDEFLEHGQVGHQHSLYQELLHVPFVLRVPNVEGGKRITSVAESIDIMPTVLACLGAPESKHAQGRSLLPLVTGVESQEDSRVVVAETAMGRKVKRTKERFQSWCMYSGTYKFIVYEDDLHPAELYDLASDPGERTSLLDPELLAEMQAKFELWKARTTELEPSFHKGLAKRTQEDLKALGYAGDDEE